ncbi:MAG: glycosyltransferase family 39 protein [Proteobacteria bacterium]|nr:glycosyltransferase family 39 protein [Pseudomonadota bacterium]
MVDPTEARYASIAQEMVRSGDWLTPHLPMPEGIVPYLGKPPLHFWLTAAAFELFGMDTWSARLPSFLGALLILGAVFFLAKQAYGRTTAILATLITISSAMFFFISGTSVIDVTLTATTTAAVAALYMRIVAARTHWWLVPLAAFFGALGFLTKGPIALVLIFLPFFLWGGFRRDLSWIRNTSWVSAMIVFIATATPWFIQSEYANPGFLKYFIWNENIARYLFKSYGDLYGSGHVYPRGTSWLMLLVAFLPWTIVLGWRIKQLGIKTTKELLRIEPSTLFVLCWGITATFFFTFVRQLHALYILPSIPGLAILTARLWCATPGNDISPEIANEAAADSPATRGTASTWVALAFTIILGAAFIFTEVNGIGDALSLPSPILALMVFVMVWGYLYARRIESWMISDVRAPWLVGLTSVCVFVCSALVAAPFISQKRSAEPLLHRVAQRELHNAKTPTIGIFTENTYSPYWASRATGGYLEREVQVSYLPPEQIAQSDLDYILVKKKEEPPTLREHYAPLERSGPWQLFGRISAAAVQ